MDPNKVKKKSVLKALIQEEKANTQTESQRTGKTITGLKKTVKKSNKGGNKIKEVNKTQKTLSGGTKQVQKVKEGGRLSKTVTKRNADGDVVKKRKVNRSTVGAFAKKVKAAFKKAKSTEDAYKPRTASAVAKGILTGQSESMEQESKYGKDIKDAKANMGKPRMELDKARMGLRKTKRYKIKKELD